MISVASVSLESLTGRPILILGHLKSSWRLSLHAMYAQRDEGFIVIVLPFVLFG